MPNPIASGENKGLEEDGKMMLKDLPPSEDRHPIECGHLACQKGRRDARVMTKEAEVMRRLWWCLYSIFPFST